VAGKDSGGRGRGATYTSEGRGTQVVGGYAQNLLCNLIDPLASEIKGEELKALFYFRKDGKALDLTALTSDREGVFFYPQGVYL